MFELFNKPVVVLYDNNMDGRTASELLGIARPTVHRKLIKKRIERLHAVGGPVLLPVQAVTTGVTLPPDTYFILTASLRASLKRVRHAGKEHPLFARFAQLEARVRRHQKIED